MSTNTQTFPPPRQKKNVIKSNKIKRLIVKKKNTYLIYELTETTCLVPRPHFPTRPKRFGSRGPSNVRFPVRSPRIRQRSELTERDWENAVQALGKEIT